MPCLDDNGYILIESRAIAIYLIERFFPNGHSLYPKDSKNRALINQHLQFDCGTLYPRIRAVAVSEMIYKMCWQHWFLFYVNLAQFDSGRLCILVKQPFRMKFGKNCSTLWNYWINSWKAKHLWLAVNNQQLRICRFFRL